MVEIATLTRPLRQGEAIKGSDVTIERRPKIEAGTDGVSPEQAIGMAVRQPMRGGQAVRMNDLMKPVAVQRNEPVTITYQMPGLLLSIRGKAVDAGSVGDIVSVVNMQTSRTVQATVTGPGRVTVASATPVVAAADSAETAGITQRTSCIRVLSSSSVWRSSAPRSAAARRSIAWPSSANRRP
jgi:flagella basal body P-ring formation protein FlgA